MYLWRRLAGRDWLIANEEPLRSQAGDRLAIIEQPARQRLEVEVACTSATEGRKLAARFGGRIKKLPRDWLKRFLRKQKTKPIKIGGRHLIIPAGAAFGTGTHATTAMSLQLLEGVMRIWGAHAPSRAGDGAPAIVNFEGTFRRGRRKEHARRVRSPELIVDLGTGSGILALAARCFGARRVVAIDIDPIAISTAKENARRNRIANIHFKVGDVRRWRFPGKIDIVTANLFSELLVEILPKLKRVQWLILSGILREQERDLVRALKRNKINLLEVRRRGKWVAVLATVS